MSFTVARRTREIGLRVALGAPRRRIVLAVFRRPLTQLGMGIVLGGLVAGILLGLANRHTTLRDLAGFGAYIALMTGVCLLACVAPTRRALGVEPSEALRSE
jgi:ABC-type antimicrobial peptide transport system permease subunit